MAEDYPLLPLSSHDSSSYTQADKAKPSKDGLAQAKSKSLNQGDENESSEHHVVYNTRWYILTVFSLLSCMQSGMWFTWGGIADTAKVVLNWQDDDIALLSNWCPIVFILTGFMFSYLLLIKGLRLCVLCSALFLLLGLGIRCIPVGIENVKWTMNIAQIFVGLAGPVLQSASTELSAVWFPPHQRATSTAIASTSQNVGIAMSFLVGPLVVSNIPDSLSSKPLDPVVKMYYFNQIMELMYIVCGATAIVVVAALLYFPEKPPTSPSPTATKSRDGFKEGYLKMFKSANFWIVAAAYSITGGVFAGWSTQMDTIFQSSLDVDQRTIGQIGCLSNITALIGGLAVARLVDIISGRMKLVLIVLVLGACIGSLWCVLLSMSYISYNLVSLYIACISIGTCLNASTPIFFEMTVEGMYPVSEGNITMVLSYLHNTASLIFLLFLMVPYIGVMWMNWFLLCAVSVALLLLILYKERYNRLDEDMTESTS